MEARTVTGVFLIRLTWLFVWLCLFCAALPAQESPLPPETATADQTQEETTAQQKLITTLLSMNETLAERKARLDTLNVKLEKAKDTADKTALQTEVDILNEEILQADQEIDLVVLGLQARQYNTDTSEQHAVDIKDEITKVFEPIVLSLQKVTEPARRMEELRQLAEQAQGRIGVARSTLDNLAIYTTPNTKFPKQIQERIDKHETLWKQRLQEAGNLAKALEEQLAAAQRAKGNSFKQFTQDFGSFVLNRGASLLMALGLGLGFILLCQGIRILTAKLYRARHNGVLSASMRIFSMGLSVIGVIGGFIIAITIFNIRHDWLMLAMSLLLAVGISWTFIRSLSSMMEQARVLLNLGAIREGERTVINGLPYKVERLSVYSKLSNPALNGGELIYPVRELIGMHSRPVPQGEAWFPTQEGDWIVRDERNYKVIDQTPEHVILQRPGGSQDFVPAQEFLGSFFEMITHGYRAKYEFGLDYKHLAQAGDKIPRLIEKAVNAQVEALLGVGAIVDVDARFVELGDSALKFDVLVDVGSGYGSHWRKMQEYINIAVTSVCLEHGLSIPFPQLVVHKSSG